MIKLAYNKANSNLVFKIEAVIRTSMAGGIVEYYEGTLVDTSTVPDTETPNYRVQVMGFESDWLLVPTDIGGTSGVNNQSKTVNASTEDVTVVADTGYTGLSDVKVNAVANVEAGNIKSGVTILGVEGSVVELVGETAEVTPTTSAQTITPITGNGITEVAVSAVTSDIDSNITADNIKDGVTILGVTGNVQAYKPPVIGLQTIKNEQFANSTEYTFKICALAEADLMQALKIETVTIIPYEMSQDLKSLIPLTPITETIHENLNDFKISAEHTITVPGARSIGVWLYELAGYTLYE